MPILGLFVIGFLLSGGVRTYEAQAFTDPDMAWPSAVNRIEDNGVMRVYRVAGLYGNREQWEKVPTKVYRMFKFFGDADSLAVDPDSAAIWITTDRTPDMLPDLVDGLARVSGFVPTWEELLARDRSSGESSRRFYRLLGQKRVGEHESGLSPFRVSEGSGGSLVVQYYENPGPFGPSKAVYSLSIARSSTDGVDFNFSQSDSVASDYVYSELDKKLARSAIVRLAHGVTGNAIANDTTAHCKGQMRQALRVYDEGGLCVWSSEEGLVGTRCVYAIDINGDTVDEIVAIGDDHGHPLAFVFGTGSAD